MARKVIIRRSEFHTNVAKLESLIERNWEKFFKKHNKNLLTNQINYVILNMSLDAEQLLQVEPLLAETMVSSGFFYIAIC